MEEKAGQTKKRRWRWGCCGIPALLVVLAIVAMTVSVFVIEKRQADRMSKRDKPETYSEIFNTNFPPDYTVSVAEEGKFNQIMVDLLQVQENDSGTFNINYSENEGAKLLRPLKPDEKITKANSDMKFIKDYYPEGYYLVVNSVLKTPKKDQIVQNFYMRSSGDEDRIDFVVHELSHYGRIGDISSRDSSGYVLEDKKITTGKQANMPQGDELLKYIGEPVSFDDKYLKENKHDIYTTLDEVVSYTKSVRVARVFAHYNKGGVDEDAPQGLSRQLYYLSLHLKNIKENYPNLWLAMKKDKGFAYIMSRVISIAKTEIQAARDEGVSGFTGGTDHASSIDSNLSLFNESQALFDELFAATGIDTMDNLQDLTQQELSVIGVKTER